MPETAICMPVGNLKSVALLGGGFRAIRTRQDLHFFEKHDPDCSFFHLAHSLYILYVAQTHKKAKFSLTVT